MFNLNTNLHASHTASDIRITLIDEKGNYVNPDQLKEVDYMARFQHKSVVNKVYLKMVEDKRSGIIEVYQDKIIVKEN